MFELSKAQAAIALAFLFLAGTAYSATAIKEIRSYDLSVSAVETSLATAVESLFPTTHAQIVDYSFLKKEPTTAPATSTTVNKAVAPTTSAMPVAAIKACVDLARSPIRGEKGDHVLNLQKLLAEKGYLSQENVIGEFGPRTQAAVAKLQKDSGIEQTGTVGPITRAKLRCVNAGVVPGNPGTAVSTNTPVRTMSEKEKEELAERNKFNRQVTLPNKEQAEALIKKYNITTNAARGQACSTTDLRGDFVNDSIVNIWDLVFLDKYYNKLIAEITEPFYNYDTTKTTFGFDYLLVLAQDFGKSECAKSAGPTVQ